MFPQKLKFKKNKPLLKGVATQITYEDGVMKKLAMFFLVLSLTQWIAFSASMPGMKIPDNTTEQGNVQSEEQPIKQIWTCAMHPQIRSNKPGKCPICGMTLIPVSASEKDENSSSAILTLSPSAVKLAEVETAPVVRKEALAEVNLVGKLEYNETRNMTISAKFPGRVEKLYLNYVGAPIRKGEHIAELFSAEISVLQRELILTNKYLAGDDTNNNKMLPDPQKTFDAAVNKARLWGLTDDQIREIINRGTISRTMTLYSPVMGIVKEQKVLENQYFKEGDVLFVIADLSNLWLMLDAYEQDLPFITYGQKVEFSVAAFPGKKFYGTVAYINPTVDDATRTIQVRVIVGNSEGKLKPGMFARATLFAHMGSDGTVLPEDMRGKWICPMHRDVISDEPGECPICSMSLESAEELGLSITKPNQDQLPLLIPYTAPLITGKRAVVYVELSPGKYEGREIAIGPRAGDYYIVQSGLKEGELVVVKGNFKIDSELQIHAKPSMMNPAIKTVKKEGDTKSHSPQNALKGLYQKIWDGYFKIQTELTKGDMKNALSAVVGIKIALESFDMKSLDDASHKKDMAINEALLPILTKMASESNIDDLRNDFLNLSAVYKTLILKDNNSSFKEKVYEFYCPMAADNKGGIWFQNTKETSNPYFAEVMKECGSLTNTYKGE